MSTEDRTETRIDALLSAFAAREEEGASDDSLCALRQEVEWLAGRYRRLDRNLHKLSRVSDRMQSQILELNDKLLKASITDPLTGLANRRGAADALSTQTRAALDHGTGFCIALLDIDHFKAVNDTHGHDVGDEVLVEVSARLTSSLRDNDMIARWGGEEFLVMLRDTSITDAALLIEGFLESLRERPVMTGAGPLKITVSGGLSPHDVSDDDFDHTILKADRALYAAKDGGRDQWCFAEG